MKLDPTPEELEEFDAKSSSFITNTLNEAERLGFDCVITVNSPFGVMCAHTRNTDVVNQMGMLGWLTRWTHAQVDKCMDRINEPIILTGQKAKDLLNQIMPRDKSREN